jgi:Na+/H+ antiporter NhaD/arsenite permease-like protein
MAVVFLLLGFTQFNDIFSPAMNWNVFMIIAGTMIVVSEFIESGMPSLLADWMMSKVSSTKWAIILLAGFAGVISAFVDNVATVLIVAPIALDIAKKTKISPVPLVIAVSVFANAVTAARASDSRLIFASANNSARASTCGSSVLAWGQKPLTFIITLEATSG